MAIVTKKRASYCRRAQRTEIDPMIVERQMHCGSVGTALALPGRV